MRILELLKGQVLTYHTYSWNTTYSKLLLRDNLHTETGVTSESGALANNNTTYQNNNIDFIQPFKYASRFVIDGTARGNIKVKIWLEAQTNPGSVTQYVKVTPSLVAITSAGVERTLATGSTTSEMTKSTSWGDGPVSITTVFPFFIDVDNQIVIETERLLLRCNIQLKYASLTGTVTKTITYFTAINSQDTFVEIPVVA